MSGLLVTPLPTAVSYGSPFTDFISTTSTLTDSSLDSMSLKNDDFRKLVASTPARQQHGGSPPGKTPALGAQRSSLIPGTPRSGKTSSGNDFARQVREQHASLRPTKKFKSSAPKGSKFAVGYTDRAKARQEAGQDDEIDDRAKRVKALEEQVKLGQLDSATFEALQDKILGGDVTSTHLVKGLDRKLLERVRRGEDVFRTGGENRSEEMPPDVDEELDKFEEREVETLKKEKTEKKGIMASPPVAGIKRTRDAIMAELKAQRKAAADAKAAAASSFDNRWRKVGEQAKPKIEIDHKGREILTTVDEDGNVKKKVRKAAIDMPDAGKPVLGADVAVPEPTRPAAEDEDDDDDIFAEAGTEYNPLGDVEDDDDDSDEDEEVSQPKAANASQEDLSKMEELMKTDDDAKAPRNYFKDSAASSTETEQDRFKGIENVLKKAAKLDKTATADDDGPENETVEEREARLAKRARMLQQQDRDFEDMDMGFGSSRFEDEDEAAEGKKIRLSQWKGSGDDDGWEEDERGTGKKKRKSKKRKGDVNNAADIMRVIEGRKAGGSK